MPDAIREAVERKQVELQQPSDTSVEGSVVSSRNTFSRHGDVWYYMTTAPVQDNAALPKVTGLTLVTLAKVSCSCLVLTQRALRLPHGGIMTLTSDLLGMTRTSCQSFTSP